jgi:tRNA(Ile)-lysidine synthase
MGDRIELQFRRDLTALVPEGATVLAAVSGGGDSVALLHLLVRAARSRRLRITVAHLDHGLRRGSRSDRRFVEGLAAELSVDCISDRQEVAGERRRDESPEEAARRVRRSFLLRAASMTGTEWIATGHTLDDQAETVLMRLVRGAGATALTGMAEAGPGPFVRPLLGFERSELRDWLRRRGLEFREDPTNRSMQFDRNRVRRLVLPVLAEQLNPRAARHLVKAARRFREDAVYLDGLADRLARKLCRTDRSGRLVIEARGLGSAPPVLARRVARLALERAGADPRRLGARHVESLLGLTNAPGRSEIHLPGRLKARKTRGRIVISGE